jgi:hypothetical protein
MGFRFRKRIRLGQGIWINLSKKGGSLSVGGLGATMNVSKKGVRDTFRAGKTVYFQYGTAAVLMFEVADDQVKAARRGGRN